MSNHQLKRTSALLSPPISEPNKKYLFEPENLIAKNKFFITAKQIEDAGKVIYQDTLGTAINSMETTESASQQTAAAKEKKIKIPPIYMHNADKLKYQEIISDLKDKAKNEFTTVIRNKQLRINLSSVEDYRVKTRHYSDSALSYHTFKNPENNNLSVIIRNVPVSLTEDEIKNELITLKYPVQKVARFYNKDRYPIPICAVDLSDTKEGKEIFNLTNLNYCIVEVEIRRKSKEIPQCKKCQLYGHTRNYCQSQDRCVKCTGHHLYTQCPKRPEEDPQCVNCLEKHPENYKGCSYYLKISKKPPFNTSIRTPDKLYSEATKRRLENVPNEPPIRTHRQELKLNSNTTQENQESTDFIFTIISKIVELIIPHLDKLIPLLTTLIPTLLNNGST